MNDQMSLFNEQAEGKKLRDEGMERVTQHNLSWLSSGIAIMRQQRNKMAGIEATGEMVKHHLMKCGLPKPAHPNAWGAMIRQAVHLHLLVDTGKSTHAIDAKSHACRVPVWRWS